MADDVGGIEGRAGKGADSVGSVHRFGCLASGYVIQIRPEHTHRSLERIRTDRRLPPPHHLRIEPGSLHWIGPARILAPDQQIAAALAHGAIGRDFSPAIACGVNYAGL